MTFEQTNCICEKCKKPFEPTEEPVEARSTTSGTLCPTCKEKYSVQIMLQALQGNVEKMVTLASNRKR